MSDCTYKERDGKFVCARCGDVRNKLVRRNCPKAMRGLGDVIAAATTAIGIKPCGGCKERQEALNRIIPFSETKQ